MLTQVRTPRCAPDYRPLWPYASETSSAKPHTRKPWCDKSSHPQPQRGGPAAQTQRTWLKHCSDYSYRCIGFGSSFLCFFFVYFLVLFVVPYLSGLLHDIAIYINPPVTLPPLRSAHAQSGLVTDQFLLLRKNEHTYFSLWFLHRDSFFYSLSKLSFVHFNVSNMIHVYC